MNIAIECAKKGVGHTWKNPIVGAVIVKNERIIAKGYHHRFGEAHAEIDALNQLDDINKAKGATIYVTLEPCSHSGKTPPCAKELVEVGIKRVVIGQIDPNPLVTGKGIKILQNAGIETVVLANTAFLNPEYNFFFKNGRPFTTVKYAMTLDGKINSEPGKRSILNNHLSFEDSQVLRSQNQAILVGERTLSNDDPMLTVRTIKTDFFPLRVLLVNDVDKVSRDANIFKSDAKILFLTRKSTQKTWPSNVEIEVKTKWTASQIMDELFKRGIQSLLVEGGSQTQAHFLGNDVVDQIVVYVTPRIFGGKGLPAVLGEEMKRTDFKLVSRSKLADGYKVCVGKEVACLLETLRTLEAYKELVKVKMDLV